MAIKFKSVPISTLHEDPANARKHPERNRAAVRSSLAEFGQVEALVVQKGTGRVIGGNCRLGELRALGVEEVMVSEVDLGGVDATRLGLILNRSAETAEWDTDTLTELLKSLDDEDALEGLGWDDAEIEALLQAMPDVGPSDDLDLSDIGGASDYMVFRMSVPKEAKEEIEQACRVLGDSPGAPSGQAERIGFLFLRWARENA